jgi:hypothetical protein
MIEGQISAIRLSGKVVGSLPKMNEANVPRKRSMQKIAAFGGGFDGGGVILAKVERMNMDSDDLKRDIQGDELFKV